MQEIKYRLVAMDLDGTLLTEDHQLEPKAIEAIRAAADIGVTFTIATGRMHGSATRFAEALGVEVPLITYNGSVVRCAISGREYRHLRVPLESARQSLEAVGMGKALRYVFVDDRVYTDTPDEWTDRYGKILGVEMNEVADLMSFLDREPTMIVFMCDEGVTRPMTEYLAGCLKPNVRLTNSNPWFVDVLNCDASKASALAFLAESLGIPVTETIAIGDSWNDLEMIQAAGLGVAVSNGTDRLKSGADYVTKAERGLGVVEVLEKFVLK